MKTLFVLTAIAGMALAAPLAVADPDDNASSHVYVVVDPNIAVQPDIVSVNLGSVQTGTFDGDVRFRIDANTQTIRLYTGVSNLYKGNDPTNADVAPILVSLPEGVYMDAENANPTGGHSPVAAYVGPTTIETFPGHYTEWVSFESSQNNHFSQYMTLTPTWTQTDPEKPMGEYSGVVALWAMIVL